LNSLTYPIIVDDLIGEIFNKIIIIMATATKTAKSNVVDKQRGLRRRRRRRIRSTRLDILFILIVHADNVLLGG